jgi:Tol biopolymer transport system component
VLGRQTTDVLPDGTLRRELVARSDAGTEVLLWSAAGADVRPQKAWAHDDSFVSFKIAEPSTADSDILRADVDWSTGVPALGTTTVVVDGVMGSFPSPLNLIPIFEGFDVSPDGNRVVYGARDFVAGGIDLFVLDLATGTTLALGSGRRPAWSEDGSRIAFQGVNTGVFTIRADGSDLLAVRQTGEQPVWSPDGAWLGLTATIQTGRGSKVKTADEVVLVPSQGGADGNLTTDVDPNVRALGWR